MYRLYLRVFSLKQCYANQRGPGCGSALPVSRGYPLSHLDTAEPATCRFTPHTASTCKPLVPLPQPNTGPDGASLYGRPGFTSAVLKRIDARAWVVCCKNAGRRLGEREVDCRVQHPTGRTSCGNSYDNAVDGHHCRSSRLRRRPTCAPEYERESRALLRLARAHTGPRDVLLQTIFLADTFTLTAF